MAKLSKQEFADKCGMNTRSLAVYISREKVVMNNKDELDDRNPKNAVFIAKYSKKAAAKGKKPEPVNGEEKKEPAADQGNLDEWTKLEREKLQEQVEKLKHENRKLKLGNEKTVGTFIPVDHVTILAVHLSEAIHLAWENEFESVIVDIGGRFGLSREEITTIKSQKVALSNISRERALKECKKMLRRLQNETSDKKGVGEHG